MDHLTSQFPDASSYVSAPTSPSGWSLNSMNFYSAPTSPIQRVGSASSDYEPGTPKTNEDVNSNLDDFEFETSRKFADDLEFETSQKFEYAVFEYPMDGDQQQQEKQTQPERVDSAPIMAFADELFCNGLVLPLKLPPRLRHGNDQSPVASSPRSPSSKLRIPFARRMIWNDEFDPFMVALEKVREEKRGRNSGNHHRRSRSLSPFRTTTLQPPNESQGLNQHQQRGPSQPIQQMAPKPIELVESKGSAYARWARQYQTMGHDRTSSHVKPSPKTTTKPKDLPFGRQVIPVKMGQHGPTKKSGEEIEGVSSLESKMQKIKGVLLRYASFGKEYSEGKQTNQIAVQRKPSYFKRLSFSFKGNSHGNGNNHGTGNKRVSEVAIVQYKPNMALCLGYGMGSPRNLN